MRRSSKTPGKIDLSFSVNKYVSAASKDLAKRTLEVKKLLKRAYELAKPISRKANSLIWTVDKEAARSRCCVSEIVRSKTWHDICDFEDLADAVKYAMNNCAAGGKNL